MRHPSGILRCDPDKISIRIDQGFLQVADQQRHALITPVRAFLRTFQYDLLNGTRQIGNIFSRGDNLLLQVLQRDLNRGIPVKGHPARQHLIHGDAQRIDITLGIGESAP